MNSAQLPNRQSIRKRGWNYAAAGLYFVTINAYEGRAVFGVIVNGRMVLNDAGRVAGEEWHKSARIRKGIELDEFVVMPNHVHGIVRLHGPNVQEGEASTTPRPQFGKPIAGALGTFVGAYKAAVSREIHRRGLVHQARAFWHRNYWDVIVRDATALAIIRNYIRFNPQNYEAVMNVGEPRLLGNAALLDMPKMGFLASRDAVRSHGVLPLRASEAIISGFLSPMEREVLKAGLEHQRQLIWVKPWGLEESACSCHVRRAIDEGRLLILSPFADNVESPSVRRAAWCNQYVLAHCNRMVVGHLSPGGMLACVLSESDPEKEIVYL